MMKFDLMNYAGHSVVGYGVLVAYDMIVEGNTYDNNLLMKDAMVFALSTISSSLVFDVVSGILPYFHEGSVGGMITRPLLTGIIYMWLYDYMISNKYNGTREDSKNFMVGAGLCLVTGYLQNPIMSLFGLSSQY